MWLYLLADLAPQPGRKRLGIAAKYKLKCRKYFADDETKALINATAQANTIHINEICKSSKCSTVVTML